MKVKYLNQDEFKIDTAPFASYIKKLSGAIELMDGTLNMIFVNDKYIRALNKAYRGKDKATDVLSFSYGPDELIGEVYVSVEMAERQAKDIKRSLSDELIRLIVHGILHVHGFDHERDSDYKKMFAVEKKVLGKIVVKVV